MTDRPRILACTFACCPPNKPGFAGGEDVLGWNLLGQIAKQNDVWALTTTQNKAGIEEAVSEGLISDVTFEYFDLPGWLKPMLKIQGGHQAYYFFWQIKAYFVARRLHREKKFDLFHHITYANDWMASLIGGLLPVPYVRGPGGGAHRTPKGFLQEYSLKGRFWEMVRSAGQWAFRHDPFFVISQNRAKAILVCTPESMAQLPHSWGQKAHFFPVSGVSKNDMKTTTSAPKPGGTFEVLSAGKLLRIKGFALAIRAFKHFVDRNPDARLTIAGRGPEESYLNRLISDLGLEGKVNLCGEISRDSLLEKMATSDVFLFTSLRDGGGTVVVEAMAVGTPVVCLDAAGPGLHVNEDCGIKVAPQSPSQAVEGLAGALESLYLDRDLLKTLGDGARERAANDYDWDRMGDRLMRIYDEGMAQNNAR